MKAIAIEEYGGREKLKVMDVPKPVPQPGEVLIRIMAAGVNPVDCKIRQGYLKDRLPNRFPLIPGWDAAGVVVSTGAEVFAYCRKPVIQHGTYAEYVSVPETYVAAKPRNLSFEEAASIPLAALTAYQSLFDAAGLGRGQNVLIHAAAGGVGGFAVQLARDRGATIWATASRKNHEYVRGLGAHHVIDYTACDFREKARNMDVVFDTVGGDVQIRSADCVKKGGVLVSILAYQDEAALKAKGIVTKYVFVTPNASQLAELAAMAEQGRLKTHLAAVFPLEEAAQAHEMIESRHTRGKIVLRT
jgi:NADPH:quinone reductase-like Zn-dependent oxidoreductase